MYKNLKIHFIGIGGIGMSGIAEVLVNLGYPVSGSDIKASPSTEYLAARGVKIFLCHHSDNVQNTDVVVYSSAVTKDNIEILTAKKLGIPVVRRAEMLAELMRLKKYGIAVAGTHGKTTTTSLIAHMLEQNGFDPTLVIGGKLNQLGTNAKLGKGDFMVVEADESDGSFLHLSPTLSVITNIDLDHMENFKDDAHYISAFDEFAGKIPFYGLCVICGEDPQALALAKRLDKRVQVYGFSKEHDWSAVDIEPQGFATRFKLYHGKNCLGDFSIRLMGKHNVLNALSVIAVAFELGIPIEKIRKSLDEFTGVGRRLECVFSKNSLYVFDDYGHHPSEIRATLDAVKTSLPKHRIKVLFQPHRYSRLKFFFDDFASCFELADEVYLTPVYAAGEKPIRGISSQSLCDAMKTTHAKVEVLQAQEDPTEKFVQTLTNGEVLLVLGAGDITNIARKIGRTLQAETTATESLKTQQINQ